MMSESNRISRNCSLGLRMATQCGAIDDLALVRDFRLSLLVVICDKTDRKRFPKPRQTTPKKMKPPRYGMNLTMVRINRSRWLGPASLRFL